MLKSQVKHNHQTRTFIIRQVLHASNSTHPPTVVQDDAGACSLPVDENASPLAAVLDTTAARDGRLYPRFSQAMHGWFCGVNMILRGLQPPDKYGRLGTLVVACVHISTLLSSATHTFGLRGVLHSSSQWISTQATSSARSRCDFYPEKVSARK